MSVKKRGLGKGLSALISDEATIGERGTEDSIINISIDSIMPNKNQPRQEFEEKSLVELSKSIEKNGLIQPILVRKLQLNYEIIAGERRWRAATMAGMREVPCIIKDVDSGQAAKIALIENIQREDLNPIEEAIAYKKLMNEYGLTQELLGKELGKSRSHIANMVRLLNLDSKIIEYIGEGLLSIGHGKVLLGIKDKGKQVRLADKIILEDLNIRQTEKLLTQNEEKSELVRITSQKDPYIVEVEESLMRTLGTKVNLIQGKNKGKIEIEYYSLEDLDRIMEILKYQ